MNFQITPAQERMLNECREWCKTKYGWSDDDAKVYVPDVHSDVLKAYVKQEQPILMSLLPSSAPEPVVEQAEPAPAPTVEEPEAAVEAQLEPAEAPEATVAEAQPEPAEEPEPAVEAEDPAAVEGETQASDEVVSFKFHNYPEDHHFKPDHQVGEGFKLFHLRDAFLSYEAQTVDGKIVRFRPNQFDRETQENKPGVPALYSHEVVKLEDAVNAYVKSRDDLEYSGMICSYTDPKLEAKLGVAVPVIRIAAGQKSAKMRWTVRIALKAAGPSDKVQVQLTATHRAGATSINPEAESKKW